MATEGSASDSASADELRAALASLSAVDLARLKQLAKLRALGLRQIDWQDLLHEALARALAGTRRWPRDVPLVAFLVQTMRSIANEEWERAGREVLDLETDLFARGAEENQSLADLAIDERNPARDYLARRTLSDVEALFSEDPSALEVLRGLARGLTPAEVRAASRLNETQYATALKRIRRRIADFSFPESART